MSHVNTKKLLGLMLVTALAASTVGCSKKASQESGGTAETASTTANVPAPPLYQEGVEAYQAGKFDVAAAKFKELAEQGDASAQFNLGSLYRQGQGVQQNDQQAALWWAKAADQGHLDAMDNLGLRYAKGEGVEQDWVQAYKWFSIAGMRKNASAAENTKIALSNMTPEQIDQAQVLAKEWMVQHPK